jgi:hypothetical protein
LTNWVLGGKNKKMSENLLQFTNSLLTNLPSRQREVLERRFGLKRPERETLERIGKDYGLTRERVRQIQEQGLAKLRQFAGQNNFFLNYIKNHIEEWGGLRREDRLLFHFGENKFQNHVFFILHIHQLLERKNEDDNFYVVWLTDSNFLNLAEKIVDFVAGYFQEIRAPLKFEDIYSITKETFDSNLQERPLESYLDATKKIEKNPLGYFGLSFWPEITPRSVRDKALLALKYAQKPLHFQEITDLINEIFKNSFGDRKALSQTVHNELIKDERFVLVGRGLYALKEWGYWEGTVKEILIKILKESKKPLSKEEIFERLAKQRFVKKTTVLLNLANREVFARDEKGNYFLV